VIGSRVARPVRDLDRSVEFYRDRLGLEPAGGFSDHAGYDGAFFALPGGGELELTAGPTPPPPWSEEDLLVLYFAERAPLEGLVRTLKENGASFVPAANPYWNRFGHVVLDPDGFRVVLAVRDVAVPELRVEPFDGERARLRQSFELAEDSGSVLDEYLHLGSVLVARAGPEIVGHLQLVPVAGGQVELKNMAVRPDHQGRGVGRALVAEALARAADDGYAEMIVATAAADIGNLRFYQRVGFRLSAVERDAFTPETGYPEPIAIDGIPLRDRVWFTRRLDAGESGTAASPAPP